MPSQVTEPTHAPHACSACKKQKRRCDKELPQCSLCLRMARTCDYDEMVISSVDSTQALQSRIAELEMLLLQRNQQIAQLSPPSQVSTELCNPATRVVCNNPLESFPAMFFLDQEIFCEARPAIPQPRPSIPENVYKIMKGAENLRDIATCWFTTIHTWFPILSKKRFELLLANSGFEPTSDIALLFSAMYLLTDETSNCHATTRTNAYWTVKNYAVALEASAVMTPQLLQTKVLISLYEIGHAIYPAAYLSVGSCATFGKALGLDNRKDSPQMLRRFGAWAEIEELKRLWWAILLLDRYVHLGTRGHTLSTEDPHRNGALPTDDTQFDSAEMTASEPLYVTSPTNLQAGPFTRTCQATYLLGKVVTLLNELPTETPTRFTTALHLHRILVPFTQVVKADFTLSPERFATAMALTFSAMLALCDPFCCVIMTSGAHTPEEVQLQALAIASMTSIARDIASFATVMGPIVSRNPAGMSPLMGHCLYEGTVNCAWRVYEGERGDALEGYRVLRGALGTLNGRWAVGGEYLACVDTSKEILYRSPLL